MNYTIENIINYAPTSQYIGWCKDQVQNLELQTHYQYLDLIIWASMFIVVQMIVYRHSKWLANFFKFQESNVLKFAGAISYLILTMTLGFLVLDLFY